MNEIDLTTFVAKCARDPGDPLAAECLELVAEVRRLTAEAEPKALHEASMAVHGALGWGFDPNTVSPVSLARACAALCAEMRMDFRERSRDLDAMEKVGEAAKKYAAERDAALAKLAEVTAQAESRQQSLVAASGVQHEMIRAAAESQAREVALRGALEQWNRAAFPHPTEHPSMWAAMKAAEAALATPSDRSALDAMLAEAISNGAIAALDGMAVTMGSPRGTSPGEALRAFGMRLALERRRSGAGDGHVVDEVLRALAKEGGK